MLLILLVACFGISYLEYLFRRWVGWDPKNRVTFIDIGYIGVFLWIFCVALPMTFGSGFNVLGIVLYVFVAQFYYFKRKIYSFRERDDES